jgi:hypothetical protein
LRVKKAEAADSGKRAGVPTDMAEKLMALERENLDRRTSFFAMRQRFLPRPELDRRVKP